MSEFDLATANLWAEVGQDRILVRPSLELRQKLFQSFRRQIQHRAEVVQKFENAVRAWEANAIQNGSRRRLEISLDMAPLVLPYFSTLESQQFGMWLRTFHQNTLGLYQLDQLPDHIAF